MNGRHLFLMAAMEKLAISPDTLRSYIVKRIYKNVGKDWDKDSETGARRMSREWAGAYTGYDADGTPIAGTRREYTERHGDQPNWSNTETRLNASALAKMTDKEVSALIDDYKHRTTGWTSPAHWKRVGIALKRGAKGMKGKPGLLKGLVNPKYYDRAQRVIEDKGIQAERLEREAKERRAIPSPRKRTKKKRKTPSSRPRNTERITPTPKEKPGASRLERTSSKSTSSQTTDNTMRNLAIAGLGAAGLGALGYGAYRLYKYVGKKKRKKQKKIRR